MILFLNVLIILTIILLLVIPAYKISYLKEISLLAAGIIFIASLVLLKTPLVNGIASDSGSFIIASFPSFTLSYSYMIDNLSIIFIILTTFLTIIVVMTSRNIKYRLKEKYLLLFLTEFLLLNTFLTTEILLFYVFFEVILIPIFLIIGIWGSQKNKIFAANQFFLYTIFGSFFMLTGIILLYLFIGSTNIFIIKGFLLHPVLEKILFLLFFISFMVKIPSIPLHLWLPQAHVEAPTTGSILLAGILLKLGSYGFIRFLLFLFPNASFYFLPLILSLALISIIFSSITVLRQIDLKRIVAYSSIAHMNFLVSAIFVKNLLALTGSLLLQIAHGLSSSALFFLVGILYDRYKSRNIFYYGGLSAILPFLCFFFFIFSLANLGFPLTVNFVSELLIFLGLFKTVPSIAILSLSGIFLSAVYSFTVVTRIAFGPASIFIRYYYDLTRREFYIITPLAILVLFLGIFPTYLTSYWTFYLITWL
jgi:proton-translocating NADH-quinone oxidoreductase chain M